ncbi:MAG: hypothetical protein HN742_29070 [Lentisphaerae bacterium]|nr:hypothetical protein [Lentisphaerota bacterium]MBT5607771.1 hypothetical protein [Lentisphaerota bacterium]MBT7845960.1 hypothetical protein [Lentisphaerota bacterium]
MRTGIKTIIAGVILFPLGACVVPLAIVLPLILRDSDEEQFTVPGKAQIAIQEPGRHYLWNDHETIFEGRSYNRSADIPDGTQIMITNAQTGEQFDFVGDASISSGSRGGARKTIGYVEIQTPCTVEIEVVGGDCERVFSFSEFELLPMLGLILGAFASAGILTMAGLGITVWGIVKLARSNERGEQSLPPDGTRFAPAAGEE